MKAKKILLFLAGALLVAVSVYTPLLFGIDNLTLTVTTLTILPGSFLLNKGAGQKEYQNETRR